MVNRELPQILILKRKYIQKFPNNFDVGVYYSEDLKQYIPISLQGSNPIIRKEEVINTLKSITEESEIVTLMFDDSSELNVNKNCADIILPYILENEVDFHSSEQAFLDTLLKATS